MFPLVTKKEEAISLRKKGYTYSEILKKVPVAKSTLSEWLRNVGLSKPQEQRITEKRIKSSLKGARIRKEKRLILSNSIYQKSECEIDKISKRELWLIGIALYWAEGSKEKDYKPGSGAAFCNSDASMVRLFLRWLKECCLIEDNDLTFQLYIHETSFSRTDEIIKYWVKNTGFSRQYFKYIYYKKNKINTKRKNVSNLYFGLLRVKIKRSSSLVRQIRGWTNGICKNCGIV